MSGHSKWANIRFRKAAQDAKRGKIFTKLIREITTAARLGGGDESSNPRLRSAVISALAQNMTRDTIKRAIDRGVGGGEGANLETIVYEGYGVGGAAVMVECMTDNRNRQGVINFIPDEDGKVAVTEDTAMEIALEAGADDVQGNEDGSVDVYTTPEAFPAVVDAFTAKDIKPSNAEITMTPSTEASLDKDTASRFLKMVDALEELDDVQNVYHNAAIPDDVELD